MRSVLLMVAVLLVAMPAFAFEKSNVVVGGGVMHHNAKEIEESDVKVDDTQPMIYLGYAEGIAEMGMLWSRNNETQKLFGVAGFDLLAMPMEVGTLVFNIGGGFAWEDWKDNRDAVVVWGAELATEIGAVDMQFGYLRQTPGSGDTENLWHVGAYVSPGE